jgi:putative membrane protein
MALSLVLAASTYAQGQSQGQGQGQDSTRQGQGATSGQTGTSGQTETSTTRTTESQSSSAASDARTFINDMAIAGMAEVELGKLASERGMNAEVKQFGQTMVKDHTQANSELTRIASEMKVQPPKELDQRHRQLRDRLSKLRGAEFDREYMMAMVEAHEEVAGKLRMFGGGSQTTSNVPSGRGGSQAVGTTGGAQGEQALRQWAARTLTVVERHLETARALNKKVAGQK